MNQMQERNLWLRQLVAEMGLDKAMLWDVSGTPVAPGETLDAEEGTTAANAQDYDTT